MDTIHHTKMGVGISLKWEWETHQNAGGNLTKMQVRNPLAILSGIPTKIFMGIPRYRFSEIPGTEMRIPLGSASRGTSLFPLGYIREAPRIFF